MGRVRVEVWHDGKDRRLARAEVDLDPRSQREVLGLLEAEARRLRFPVEALCLRVWDPQTKAWIKHRTTG